MRFVYLGKNAAGKNVQGTISATSKANAEESLNNTGISVINLEPEEQISFISKVNIFNYPTTSDLIIFAKQMHSLLHAGVPIIRSINIVSNSCKNEKLANALANIAVRLEAGYAFGISMEKFPKIFPKLVRALVTIGEQTGTLANIFQQISIYLHKQSEISKGIKTATRYPLLVLITIIVAMFIINIVVIPNFAKFFNDFKAQLPLPTRILILTSELSIKYWWVLILMILGSTVLLFNFIHTKPGRYLWDRYKIKTPIIGSIIERSLLSGFTRSFALCFRTGVPLLESLALIANTCNNAYIESKIIMIKSHIEHGESMTIAAKNCGIFNGLVLQMILIGEESGELDRLLEEVSLFYDEELDYDIKKLSSLIEPLLIAIMSVMVTILALGIFLPIWSLAQTTGGL